MPWPRRRAAAAAGPGCRSFVGRVEQAARLLRVSVPGGGLRTGWAIAGPQRLRLLGDPNKLVGLDQLVRLEAIERARADAGERDGRRRGRIGKLEDTQAVVLPEHPVVVDQLAAGGFRDLCAGATPVLGVIEETGDRFVRKAE